MTSSKLDIYILDYKKAETLDLHRWSNHPKENDFLNEVYFTLKSIKRHQNTGKKLLSSCFWIFMSLGAVGIIHKQKGFNDRITGIGF